MDEQSSDYYLSLQLRGEMQEIYAVEGFDFNGIEGSDDSLSQQFASFLRVSPFIVAKMHTNTSGYYDVVISTSEIVFARFIKK